MINKLFGDMVSRLVKAGEAILETLTPAKVHLWHMATGVSGEAGELLDAVKKYVIYGKELDRNNIKEELGDLEFYMESIRKTLGFTREEILEANVEKLTGKKGRYQSGTYSDAAAQSRADKQ